MKSVTIFTGAYGTGKTEFALNYSLYLRSQTQENITIGDLDIINPYFRSREREEFLKEYNINVSGNSLNNNIGQDLPAISGNLLKAITKNEYLVLDLAGSLNGLKVLPMFETSIIGIDYDFFLVINIFRNESSTKEKILEYINSIKKFTKLELTGLVNNSHMLHETTKEHIIKGEELVSEISKKTNIPFIYSLVSNKIYYEVKESLKSKPICFDKLLIREDWQ